MKTLIIDMTHGGVLIASEFSKLPDCNVFALDIYNTLKEEEKNNLKEKGIKLVEEDFLEKINDINARETSQNDNFLVIAPVHCNIKTKVHMTHHEAVKFLLKDKINVPIVEVTGVKGKTSIVWMLKEIFKDLNPLVLSSLGVEVFKNGASNLLKQNISITPASIIEAWQLAENYDFGICIFETSLGGTGLADVGVLTNIAENYSIASGVKTASQAKAQMFKSKITVCDYDSFNQYYSDFTGKINTFSISANSNVKASKINFRLDKTSFNVNARDIKTIDGIIKNSEFEIKTFAPAKHHLKNVLCAICVALTLNTPINQVISGLKKFKGIKGRTSIKNHKGNIIIEEINPGINVTTIKKSVKMIEKFKDPLVIFGGKYGVTCEEIDEPATIKVFNEMNNEIKLILVDELGKNIKKHIKRKYEYCSLNNALDNAVEMDSKIILLIYRSNFSDLKKR